MNVTITDAEEDDRSEEPKAKRICLIPYDENSSDDEHHRWVKPIANKICPVPYDDEISSDDESPHNWLVLGPTGQPTGQLAGLFRADNEYESDNTM